MQLHYFDWTIIILYMIGMIGLSIFLSRGQKNKDDYYLGGNDTGAWPIAISTMATQCSTTSLLGAPAFVAFSAAGGMLWLQNELAVPFAMIFLMIFLLPLYRRLGIISVYAYLEKRFDKNTRLALSLIFQVTRALATGVTAYGVSKVISYCTGLDLVFSLVALGVITIIYDSIGGMKAVIYSDVIQMIVLYTAIIFIIYMAIDLVGDLDTTIKLFNEKDEVSKLNAVDFGSFGLDGNKFGFLPMLIGGFFLYVSYYGCDQSQVQRELSTKSVDDTNWSLFINGILRFPLVLTYCFLGVCIGAYAITTPEFITKQIPKMEVTKLINMVETKVMVPDFDMSVPVFVLENFPIGAVGLVMVGLFSAAMSSLDSAINSLSATTMQDVFKSYMGKTFTETQELKMSKVLTIFWGTVCTIFALLAGGISDSIIESINMVSSLANGPILGVFILGIFIKMANGKGALAGLILGFIFNLGLWAFAKDLAWIWWNVTGCVACILAGVLVSMAIKEEKEIDLANLTYVGFSHAAKDEFKVNWKKYYYILAAYGVLITLICINFHKIA